MLPSSSITFSKGRLVLLATSKSFGSCDGVIFTAPVPNSISTYSSATIGISLFIRGSTTLLPIRCLYLPSFGFTATPVSPSIVSGLVVAIVRYSSLSFTGYFICHIFPVTSSCSISSSASAVLSFGHQLTIYSPLYIRSSLYNLMKTSFTASERPSSMVNLSLFQSSDEPSLLSCFVIIPPCFSFHSHVLSRNFSLPISSFVVPSSISHFSTLFCVAIPA